MGEIVRRIADDSLIQVANLNIDSALCIRDRTEITHMAVTANPNCRAFRERGARIGGEPFVKLLGVSPNIGMGGARHL